MKRKIFIVVMVIVTVMIAVNLFISLICGAPMDGDGTGRYVFCAIGTSVLLPAGFTLFFIMVLDLSEQLEEYKENAEKEHKCTEKEADKRSPEIPDNVSIPALVNALAEKGNLTPAEKERLLAYLEDM
ncbi:MAG: hypothetical protein Q4C61_04430 [Lachnospiraceae bacterium]|nr:hypothetical protein [Lachnospiraceae bacterium]